MDNIDNKYNTYDIFDTCDNDMMDNMYNTNKMDNIYNTNKMDDMDDMDKMYNMDNIIRTEYSLLYKKIHYIDKIIKNYYFSKFLIIYKFYDSAHNVLRKKIVVYKKNNNIYSIQKYCLNGELFK